MAVITANSARCTAQITDIAQAHRQLDEALRIRREEELPVYERLGDVHSRAMTLGKIADVAHTRGQLDEALRICREELLPVFERLGGPPWIRLQAGGDRETAHWLERRIQYPGRRFA
ncbi:hypothetical protein ACMHYB_28460 [Sorangium sp. So ce1128]